MVISILMLVNLMKRGGGGIPPYLAYTGTCHWTGYVFLGLAVLDKVYNCTRLCPKHGMVTRSIRVYPAAGSTWSPTRERRKTSRREKRSGRRSLVRKGQKCVPALITITSPWPKSGKGEKIVSLLCLRSDYIPSPPTRQFTAGSREFF